MNRAPSLNLAAHLESGATRLLLLALAHAVPLPSRSDERRPRPVDRLPHVSRPGLRSSEPDGSQPGRHRP